MYLGSYYCGKCKYNRYCYIMNQVTRGNAICKIVTKIFDEVYRKEHEVKIDEQQLGNDEGIR